MFPQEHADLIAAAKAAPENGSLFGASWSLYPDVIRGVDEVNPQRQLMSDAWGEAVYDPNHPEFARLGLEAYHQLATKLRINYGCGKVCVRVKGGNASAILMAQYMGIEESVKAGFNFSDLDVDVLINPKLPKGEFDKIKDFVMQCVRQTLATHKRRIDRAFFKLREDDGETYYLLKNDAAKATFRERICELVGRVPGAHSCLENTLHRNNGSSYSYLITKSHVPSEVIEGEMRRIKIEQPHLEKAERIPLGRAPTFITVNDTINGVRENGDKVSFTLARIKMSNIVDRVADKVKLNLCVNDDGHVCVAIFMQMVKLKLRVNDDGHVCVTIFTPYDKVGADFVDVWIGNQEDAELNSFEKRGGFDGMLTREVSAFGYQLIVPTLQECKLEYNKLLYMFDCPESKRPKRERKYASLVKVCKAIADEQKMHEQIVFEQQMRRSQQHQQQLAMQRERQAHMHQLQMQQQRYQRQPYMQQQQVYHARPMQQQQQQSVLPKGNVTAYAAATAIASESESEFAL